jgi:hypothetical protein
MKLALNVKTSLLRYSKSLNPLFYSSILMDRNQRLDEISEELNLIQRRTNLEIAEIRKEAYLLLAELDNLKHGIVTPSSFKGRNLSLGEDSNEENDKPMEEMSMKELTDKIMELKDPRIRAFGKPEFKPTLQDYMILERKLKHNEELNERDLETLAEVAKVEEKQA